MNEGNLLMTQKEMSGNFHRRSKAFQMELAKHCAPTILGLKPASLMMTRRSGEECESLLKVHTETFAGLRLNYRISDVKACQRRALFVYNEVFLGLTLKKGKVKAVLSEFGYNPDENMEELLRQLFARLEKQGVFPHEIGLFLGYPPSDVLMFAKNPHTGCLLSGYFKVYSEAEKAKVIFKSYAGCYKWLTTYIAAGNDLSALLSNLGKCMECPIAKEIMRTRAGADEQGFAVVSERLKSREV